MQVATEPLTYSHDIRPRGVKSKLRGWKLNAKERRLRLSLDDDLDFCVLLLDLDRRRSQAAARNQGQRSLAHA